MKTSPTRSARLLAAAILVAALTPAPAAAQNRARISGLTDIAFGTINNLSIDQRSSQSVCAFSNSLGGMYSVTASGSGGSGAFRLSSGGAQLDFEVEWAASPNRTSGTALTANAPLAGQVSTAANQNCSPSGISASLIVILRAAALGSATTGSYSGILTIVLAPT